MRRHRFAPGTAAFSAFVLVASTVALVGVPVADAGPPGPVALGHAPEHLGALPDREAAGKLRPCLADATHRCGHMMRPLDPHDPKAGRIKIHFELIRRSDRSRPSLGTIVAVEGGPGYATTWSRSSYEDLFEPLLDRRQLLLVDQRGTGRSGPILCRKLQSYRGNRVNAVGKCGRQLGDASDLYGSKIAADDMAAVLDRLDIRKVDLYGDSYGTFFGQTFAVRHPERVRTLTLDASYFVGGTDPWYVDTNRALRHAFKVACRRSPACAARSGSGMSRIRELAELLRRHSLVGRAPDTEGDVGKVVVTQNRLIDLVNGAANNPTIYRELDAAAAAATRRNAYNKPLLRLVREVQYHGGAGPYRLYSEGMYLAVACNDYPQPFDFTSPARSRPAQFQRQINTIRQARPKIFRPFTVMEWVRSTPYGYFDDCLKWPAPSRWIHPVPRNAVYPDVPVLVINGDLDSLTSPEGGRDTAAHFPNATYVETANLTHVSAIGDYDQCASLIVRKFVRTKHPGNTSCASRYHENRLVGRFGRTADATRWAPGPLRTAKIANATLGDVMARWWSSYAHHGAGLQGGTFGWNGKASRPGTPIIRWNLHDVRWVDDVVVSGKMRWNRRSGAVSADVTVTGSGTTPATLHFSWNDLERHAQARTQGTVGGATVHFTFPSA